MNLAWYDWAGIVGILVVLGAFCLKWPGSR